MNEHFNKTLVEGTSTFTDGWLAGFFTGIVVGTIVTGLIVIGVVIL
jgi:tetrahydromethanopterin S-methyltransferase subunit B